MDDGTEKRRADPANADELDAETRQAVDTAELLNLPPAKTVPLRELMKEQHRRKEAKKRRQELEILFQLYGIGVDENKGESHG